MNHPLTLIVLLPLVGFLLNGLLATRVTPSPLGKGFVTGIGCGLPIASFFVAIHAFLALQASSGMPLIASVYTWADIAGQTFQVAFYFDRLAAVMVLIVTGVGSLIHIYSVGYMK